MPSGGASRHKQSAFPARRCPRRTQVQENHDNSHGAVAHLITVAYKKILPSFPVVGEPDVPPFQYALQVPVKRRVRDPATKPVLLDFGNPESSPATVCHGRDGTDYQPLLLGEGIQANGLFHGCYHLLEIGEMQKVSVLQLRHGRESPVSGTSYGPFDFNSGR